MPSLLGLGDATVDIYLSEGMQYPGGNTVNVAVQARRCGMAAGWLGCLGRDMLGDLVMRGLAAEGIDTSRARRLDGPSPWSRIRHAGADRIFDGSNPGVRGRYGFGPDDARFVAAHDVVHTSIHSDIDRHLGWVRPHARLLSYDFSEHWRRPGVDAALGLVDIAFISAPRCAAGEIPALLHRIAALGPRIVVATRGAEGAAALRDGAFATQPAMPAQVVDTLGAGDGLIGGFLAALAAGGTLAECLARGAAQAAATCGHKGGFGHGAPIVAGQPGLDPGQIVRRPAAPPQA